jgi:F0F1-type ATP synthase membrane subunit b/b'
MDIYTNREIIQYIREGFESIGHRLHRIENHMADLATAEADLVTAVQNIAAFIKAGVGPLQAALTAAQAQVSADDTQIAGLLADAQTAADNIEAQVTALNALDAPVTPTA